MFRFLLRLELFFFGRTCLFLAFAMKPPDFLAANDPLTRVGNHC